MGYITIDTNALKHNFKYFSRLSGGQDKVIVGLKDNAYGHGIELVGKVLSEAGAKSCFVRCLAEANKVSDWYQNILILVEKPNVPLPEKIHTAINSFEALFQIPEGNAIELSIDTGMHRDGIMPGELEEALAIISKRKLKLKGILTHFATADEDKTKMLLQQQVFEDTLKEARKLWNEPYRVHCANTAATSIVDSKMYDANRIGLGLYGYSEYPGEQQNLLPVMALYARRIATRTISGGESIGYGSKAYIVPRDNFIVSNYDIGYGDGFLRLNERKHATIADGRPILGRVSMDSLSVEGDDDTICIFSNARQLAKVHDTIVYEILTSLNAEIERILI
ncbi:alanine racemase [Balneicella halophila]|uniref:Alanine racemase n=1 Tax=Balneicella halophila TaxID=1537566 RepID=A0A7L4UNK3_BALHA|nr:alanine racemase [Balneicella halophila]PVX50763.1 alanine racemase [Balneicella halophila]